MEGKKLRWVSLDPELDQKLTEEAKLENRSVANKLLCIIKQHYEHSSI